uniref:Uncharacterized protein n=1 Tax=Guillardia theta TaxID=55529 RepID=A0A7S4P5T5_GUITH
MDKARQLTLVSHLNSAACALKLSKEQMQTAIDHCNSALSLDGRNAKALYRRAQAFLNSEAEGDAKDKRSERSGGDKTLPSRDALLCWAIRDLEMAEEIQPGDKNVLQTLKDAKAEARAIAQRELASKEQKHKEHEDVDAKDDDLSQLFGMLRMARDEVSNLSDADRREKAAAYMEKAAALMNLDGEEDGEEDDA